eukprot:TRINITY_DN25615_c0_g1_i2.p1 TRINITY_DN25615_c0_g1~~TRINITY_DN25615_c0_g1_i2.p1  ORF type:complete len:680 (+),score=103.21 TRINITY_DN25615_c0_g1_i2:101-2140(+)
MGPAAEAFAEPRPKPLPKKMPRKRASQSVEFGSEDVEEAPLKRRGVVVPPRFPSLCESGKADRSLNSPGVWACVWVPVAVLRAAKSLLQAFRGSEGAGIDALQWAYPGAEVRLVGLVGDTALTEPWWNQLHVAMRVIDPDACEMQRLHEDVVIMVGIAVTSAGEQLGMDQSEILQLRARIRIESVDQNYTRLIGCDGEHMMFGADNKSGVGSGGRGNSNRDKGVGLFGDNESHATGDHNTACEDARDDDVSTSAAGDVGSGEKTSETSYEKVSDEADDLVGEETAVGASEDDTEGGSDEVGDEDTDKTNEGTVAAACSMEFEEALDADCDGADAISACRRQPPFAPVSYVSSVVARHVARVGSNLEGLIRRFFGCSSDESSSKSSVGGHFRFLEEKGEGAESYTTELSRCKSAYSSRGRLPATESDIKTEHMKSKLQTCSASGACFMHGVRSEDQQVLWTHLRWDEQVGDLAEDRAFSEEDARECLRRRGFSQVNHVWVGRLPDPVRARVAMAEVVMAPGEEPPQITALGAEASHEDESHARLVSMTGANDVPPLETGTVLRLPIQDIFFSHDDNTERFYTDTEGVSRTYRLSMSCGTTVSGTCALGTDASWCGDCCEFTHQSASLTSTSLSPRRTTNSCTGTLITVAGRSRQSSRHIAMARIVGASGLRCEKRANLSG